MLAGEHDRVVRLSHHVARDSHVVAERGEDPLGGVRELVVELVGRLRRHHRHGGLVRAEAVLDMEWRPRALRLVLGDDVREFARVAERSTVERPGDRAADVAHHEAHRAADGQVRAPAGAEEVVARVDVERAGDRPVDDHEHARARRGRSRAVVAPARVGDALDRGDDHGHVLGLAARHHRVDGDLLGGDGDRAVGDEPDLLLAVEPGGLEHRADPVFGRRDDRKTIRPSLREAELDGVADVGDPVALGRERDGHARLLDGAHATTRCRGSASSRRAPVTPRCAR